MFFKFRALDYHSKLPKTLAIVLKYCQLSSLTHMNPTLDKICSGFQIPNKASAGYQRRLILKLLPRTMLSSMIEIHCFVSNISCIAYLFKITFHFHCSNYESAAKTMRIHTEWLSGNQVWNMQGNYSLLFCNEHIADSTWKWGNTPWCDFIFRQNKYLSDDCWLLSPPSSY